MTRQDAASVCKAILRGAAAVPAFALVYWWSPVAAGIAAALLLALLADGIARPGSSLLYPTRTHGSRQQPYVALTFDDGPDPEVTPAVLDALARHGARATFFVIGRALHAHPALGRRIEAEHHELGNHSLNHSRWQNFFCESRQRKEIEGGAGAIAELAQRAEPPLYRPPIGLKSPPFARAARALQLSVIAWSLHSHDSRTSDPQRIARRVLARIRPGDIVLMHDGHDLSGRHRPACAQALPQILQGLREKGLQCVTVSELLRLRGAENRSAWAQALWNGLKAHFGLKMLAGWLIAGGFFAAYFLLLRFPLFPVTLMPVTALDQWIAFWPGALWLYVSLWLYVALAPGLLTDRRELLNYYLGMLALSVAGMAVFLLWPSASPRADVDWHSYPPFGPVIAADDAGNALPSLHAAFAVYSAIWLDRLLRRADAPGWPRLVSAAWALGILYSTLATRQHVAVDIYAGSALGWLAAVLHACWLQTLRPVGAGMDPSPVTARAVPRTDAELLHANRSFYDLLWRDAQLVAPQRFNTWPLVCALVATSQRRLEVAPGLRPRLPIMGTHFIDISAPALARLSRGGGLGVTGQIGALPLPDGAFDLVCALDIIEHVDDDEGALSELARVSTPGAALLLSVPLHPAQWTAFDDFVGHRRRYEPQSLQRKLDRHGFTVDRSAIYGMQPKSSQLLDLGLWFLVHRRARAMWWYNRVLMPLGLHFQKELEWKPGLIDDLEVAEIILLCRRSSPA